MTKLTDEEKHRFAPMLQRTFDAIGPDCASIDGWRGTKAEIIEVTIDADRPITFGGMSSSEYQRLCDAYRDPNTQRWLRRVLNY